MKKQFEANACPECGLNEWAVYVCDSIQVAHCTACRASMIGEPQAIRPADETQCAGIDDAYNTLADQLPPPTDDDYSVPINQFDEEDDPYADDVDPLAQTYPPRSV